MFIFPQPKKMEFLPNSIKGQGISNIDFSADLPPRLTQFARTLISTGKRVLVIHKDDQLKCFDEYKIEFFSDRIIASAATDAGHFYALITLRQMTLSEGLPARGVIHDWADVEMRIQHIDLKRIGWNFDYLLGLVDILADLKINYILLEYEDKFKFDFCSDIPVADAFSKEQIATLEAKVSDNFIQIIPLVQCIGHFEYILKHDKYLEISENPKIRSQACPLQSGTLELFKKMASEVIEAHPSSRYFHIGADEPFLLGTCPNCKAEADRIGKGKLYGNFLNQVLSWIIEEKGKTPLFWADILQHYNDAADICRKDSIAVEWNYQAQSPRGQSVKFYQSPSGKMDARYYCHDLSDEQHRRFDFCLGYDSEKKTFNSLPFGAYLKELGFDVISASNVNSIDNVKTHSAAVVRDGLRGNLATYWASANSDRPPYTIFETRLQGVCMLAASTWNLNDETQQQDNFFQRAAQYNNCAPEYALTYDIMNQSQHLIVPGDNNRQSKDYFNTISKIVTPSPAAKGLHANILDDFIDKIKLEKELDTFKKDVLVDPLLENSFYSQVDLRPYCNERFANTDDTPGWSRIYQNDLRFIPKGNVCFNGVPFRINDDMNNGQKSLIMIGDHDETPFFPNSVKKISMGRYAYALNFLHAHIEGKPLSNGHYGKYSLLYDDGTTEDIPLTYNKNMGEWWRIVELENASIAWAGENLKKANVGLHIYTHFPKYTDKKISSIDFICESQTALALAAITTINKRPEFAKEESDLVQQIRQLQAAFAKLEKRMKTHLKPFLSPAGVDEVVRIAFLFSSNYLSRLLKMLNCQ